MYFFWSMFYEVSYENVFQTMGGDFSSRGQQDCAKGIYALAGIQINFSTNLSILPSYFVDNLCQSC